MKRSLLASTVLVMLASAPVAMADHMSPDGIGTANMPNDIHNTRLDIRISEAPNECFVALVQSGDLADSVNRCEDDDSCVVYEYDANCEVVGVIDPYR